MQLARSYKCKVEIIPYMMTWEGLVANYHKKHKDKIGIHPITSPKEDSGELVNKITEQSGGLKYVNVQQ